jgi:hypothetical protein
MTTVGRGSTLLLAEVEAIQSMSMRIEYSGPGLFVRFRFCLGILDLNVCKSPVILYRFGYFKNPNRG